MKSAVEKESVCLFGREELVLSSKLATMDTMVVLLYKQFNAG